MENKPILGFVTMESLARFIFSKVSFALLNRYSDLRTGLNVVKAIGHGQSTQAVDYDKHPWYIEDAMSIYTGPGPAQQDELNALVVLKHKSETLNTDSRMIQKSAVYHITTALSDAHTHVIIIVRYPKQTDWLTGLDEVITDKGFDVTMDVVDEHGDHIEPSNVPKELHDDVVCIAEVAHEIRSTLCIAVERDLNNGSESN